MASTKVECEALSVNAESKVIDSDTQCENLTADTDTHVQSLSADSETTSTDTHVQSLSADSETTSTDTDTQVQSLSADSETTSTDTHVQSLSADSETTSTDTDTHVQSLSADSETTSTDTHVQSLSADSETTSTDTHVQSLSADSETTSTDTDTHVQSLSAASESTDIDTQVRNLFADSDTQLEKHYAEDAFNMDSMDTLTLARVDRENQGPWEAEYSYGGETDLHLHYDKCKKNPGHKNFIPVDKFSIEDLPEDYRDQDMVDYIRAVSDLTVRVTVKYVSDMRPDTFPGNDKPYPGYSARGTPRMTVGTGNVYAVNMFDNSKENWACECKNCKISSKPEKLFATIHIETAKHVVFDDCEAEHTTFHLFFDRGSTPETCEGVVTLTSGWLVGYNDTKFDNCSIQYFTHDLRLARRLETILDQLKDLKRVVSKTCVSFDKHKLPGADKQPLLFIVSHPHGCSKQISLGRLISLRTYNNIFESIQYNTPTCPGSSGAAVYLPTIYKKSSDQIPHYVIKGSHSGACEDPGINFCQVYENFRTPRLVSMHILELEKGLSEDYLRYIDCIEEEDLHKHYDTCHKNPGHQNFFPVDKFSMDDLPAVYRIYNISDFIKTVSDLTVRVSVKYVSEERPETVPGTDIPYPWYSYRGSNQTRVGNGWINDIVIHQTCVCKECLSSLSPKAQYARIFIQTARHLVYDRLEAGDTTCHVVVGSRVVTLTDIYKSYNSPDIEKYELLYVSHDIELTNSLDNLRRGFSKKEYDSFKFAVDGEQYARENMRKEPPLYVMVSHPHGGAKQISISYCSNHGNTETEDNQIPYASILCPGSSGAPLITLGWQTLYLQIMQYNK